MKITQRSIHRSMTIQNAKFGMEKNLRISLAATEDSSGTVRGASCLGTLLKNLLHQSLEGILHLQVLLRLEGIIKTYRYDKHCP